MTDHQPHELCVCCSSPAVAQVEVSIGLWAGMCAPHHARRLEAEARHRAELVPSS